MLIKSLKSPGESETAPRRRRACSLNLDKGVDLNDLPEGDKEDSIATKEPIIVRTNKKRDKQTKMPEDLTMSVFNKSSGHIFLVDLGFPDVQFCQPKENKETKMMLSHSLVWMEGTLRPSGINTSGSFLVQKDRGKNSKIFLIPPT